MFSENAVCLTEHSVKECVGRGCEAPFILSIDTRWGMMPIGTGRVVQRDRAGTSPGVEPLPYCPHVYRCTLSVGCFMMHFWPYAWLPTRSIKIIS